MRPDLSRRLENAPELLDGKHHDARELEQSLDQVAEVNRLLGGTRAVLHALQPFWSADPLRVLDVGTGSADIPLAIVRHAHQRGRAVQITASDLHPEMRAIAARRTAAYRTCIEVEEADALALHYADGAFDVVMLSLTLHHFDAGDQLRCLREAGRVAGRAVIVNELERCRANWLGAQLLARTRWRRNRLTRHDGPLSVLRAFTVPELAEIAGSAGLRIQRLERRFFFRLILVADARG